MSVKKLFPLVGLLIGLSLIAGCFEPLDSDGDGIPNKFDQCPYQPGPASNGGCPLPAQLDVNLWTNKTAYSQGEPITIYIELNKDANVTLTEVYNDAWCVQQNKTIFSNSLFGQGQHQYNATIGTLTGNKLLTATATDSAGKVDSASVCITVGSGVIMGPRCSNEPC